MSNVLDFRETRGRIIGTVETMRMFGKSDNEIIAYIRQQYNLKLKDAKEYVIQPKDETKSA